MCGLWLTTLAGAGGEATTRFAETSPQALSFSLRARREARRFLSYSHYRGCYTSFLILISLAEHRWGWRWCSIRPRSRTSSRALWGPLAITNSNGDVALGLSLSARPSGHIVVSGSKPRSPGRTSEDHFAILGLLEDPVRGLNDFTALYVAKYGVPPAGSRVFIQTAQQIDGWQDAPRVTSAVVPAA